jgi:pyruvate/2-oxoglutarate dehydrogenase complex dihydrolipoamide acyltransferase (E2) component
VLVALHVVLEDSMALGLLRRHRARPVAPPPLSIGVPDSEIFACPVCSRPMVVGARRCQGCGTRLVWAVPAAKASVFVALGLAAGIVLASAVTLGVATGVRPPAAFAPAASEAASPSPSPSATPAPTSNPQADVPVLTRAALRQAVDLHARLAAAAANLGALVEAKDLDAYAVSEELRSVASVAAQGTGLAQRISAWTAATDLSAQLGNWYREIRETARAALKAPVTNGRAYRSAAQGMLVLLAEVPSLDGETRALAIEAGVDLP